MFRVDPLNANHSTRPPGQLIYCGLEYMPIKNGPSPGLNRGPRVLKMFRVDPLNANHSTRPPGHPGLNRGPRVLQMFRVNPLNANHSTRPPGQLIFKVLDFAYMRETAVLRHNFCLFFDGVLLPIAQTTRRSPPTLSSRTPALCVETS
ncbi:hypothetical protein N7465_008366 [Penicillium sp. CMV-2018d]|nr:hypothetical protein N7465_008366 [Penicillium sp. CMV-2018d]